MAVDITNLSWIYVRREYLEIVEIGVPDYAGRAMCKLEDGSFVWFGSPCVGMVGRIREHPAKIYQHENADKVTITPWKEEPFEMTMVEVYELFKKSEEAEERQSAYERQLLNKEGRFRKCIQKCLQFLKMTD